MFTLVPVYVGTGLLVTPDAPLLFFWVATLYLISKALHTRRGWYWLVAGVTFGGALLSSITRCCWRRRCCGSCCCRRTTVTGSDAPNRGCDCPSRWRCSAR